MDHGRFDALTRLIANAPTRRALLGVLPVLGGWSLDAEAKRRKKRTKKKKKQSPPIVTGTTGCQPQCAGRECGSDGCNGLCGTCGPDMTCQDGVCQCPANRARCGGVCCPECQVCDVSRQECVLTSEPDDAPCQVGGCCGGVCCPRSCKCGVDVFENREWVMVVIEAMDYPFPACVAEGTGGSCGPSGGSCRNGTQCYEFGNIAGVCVGLCCDAEWPDGSCPSG